MKLEPVDSKVAKQVGYDPDRQVMRVVFKTGLHYEYQNVTPEKFAAYEAAPSKGQWIMANLAGKNSAIHPFQQVPAIEEEQQA